MRQTRSSKSTTFAGAEDLGVLAIEIEIAAGGCVSLKTVPAEDSEHLTLALVGNPQPAEHASLVILVRDAEPGVSPASAGNSRRSDRQSGVDRAARERSAVRAEAGIQAMGDFLSGLVGEGDRADPIRRSSPGVRSDAHSLDETPGLPRPGTRKDEYGTQGCLDGSSLLRRGIEGHASSPRPSARAQSTIASTSSSITWSAERPDRLRTPKEWSPPSTEVQSRSRTESLNDREEQIGPGEGIASALQEEHR